MATNVTVFYVACFCHLYQDANDCRLCLHGSGGCGIGWRRYNLHLFGKDVADCWLWRFPLGYLTCNGSLVV